MNTPTYKPNYVEIEEMYSLKRRHVIIIRYGHIYLAVLRTRYHKTLSSLLCLLCFEQIYTRRCQYFVSTLVSTRTSDRAAALLNFRFSLNWKTFVSLPLSLDPILEIIDAIIMAQYSMAVGISLLLSFV